MWAVNKHNNNTKYKIQILKHDSPAHTCMYDYPHPHPDLFVQNHEIIGETFKSKSNQINYLTASTSQCIHTLLLTSLVKHRNFDSHSWIDRGTPRALTASTWRSHSFLKPPRPYMQLLPTHYKITVNIPLPHNPKKPWTYQQFLSMLDRELPGWQMRHGYWCAGEWPYRSRLW